MANEIDAQVQSSPEPTKAASPRKGETHPHAPNPEQHLQEAHKMSIQVQGKEIEVVLDIRRNFQGDWSLATEAAHEKVDANKVKFIVPLKPREKQTFSYELTTRNGVNVTR